MRDDLNRYVDVLIELARPETQTQMLALWPQLCEAARVQVYAMPPVDQVHAMWPFLSSAVQKTTPVEQLQADVAKVTRPVSTFARREAWCSTATPRTNATPRWLLIQQILGQPLSTTASGRRPLFCSPVSRRICSDRHANSFRSHRRQCYQSTWQDCTFRLVCAVPSSAGGCTSE